MRSPPRRALSALLPLLHLGAALRPPDPDTRLCYSCMSELYQYKWDDLSKYYRTPARFSDECASLGPHGPAHQQHWAVDCASVCITLREVVLIANTPHQGFIRGCFDTMLQPRYSFNRTVVNRDEWLRRQMCATYAHKQIFTFDLKAATELKLCVCYGERCNAATSPRSSLSRSHRLTLCLWPLLALMLPF